MAAILVWNAITERRSSCGEYINENGSFPCVAGSREQGAALDEGGREAVREAAHILKHVGGVKAKRKQAGWDNLYYMGNPP